MKTKIFLDFDGTLFDTRIFKRKLFDTFVEAGFSKEEIEFTYKEECLDYKYSPIGHIERLKKIRFVDDISLAENIENIFNDMPNMLFSDTVEFLKSIDHSKFKVCLLTLGDIDFQKKKVYSSDIQKYFDELYFCEEQKWIFLNQLVDKDEKFFIIDDRGDAMFEINKKFPNAVTLEINRAKEPLDNMEKPSSYNGIKITEFSQAFKYL